MTDPEARNALDRLRAADPARDVEPVRLTADDILTRADAAPAESDRSTRRTWWWPAAVAAVVLIVIAAVLWRPDLEGGQVAAPAPTSGRTVPPSGPGPTAPTRVSADCSTLRSTPDEPKALAAGAEAVWLCDETGFADLVAPPDALTSGVDDLAAAYADLPRSRAGQACTADAGPVFRLFLRYSDGHTVQLRGELAGCHVIGSRIGADTMLADFAQRLRDQRAQLGPPSADPKLPSCGQRWSSYLSPTPAEFSAAVACRGADSWEGRRIKLTAAEWRVLLADLQAHAKPDDSAPTCPPAPQVFLIAVDAYGAPTQLSVDCHLVRFSVGGPRDAETWAWTPSGDSASILAELARR